MRVPVFYLLLFLILGLVFNNPGQNIRLDSLKRLLHSINNDSVRFELYHTISNSDVSNESALNTAKEGLDHAKKLNELTHIFRFYHTIGNIYGNMGDYSKALENYLLEKKAVEAANKPKAMISVYLGLGNVYSAQGKAKEALNNFLQALDLGKQFNNLKPGFKSTLFVNIGQAYTMLKDYDNAIKNLAACIKIEKENNGAGYIVGEAFSNLAEIYVSKNEPEKAFEYFIKAIVEYKSIGMNQRVAYAYNSIAKVAANSGKHTDAINYYLQAVEILGKENAKTVSVESYRGLAKEYSLAGDYKKAFEASMKFSQLKDSVLNDNSLKQMNELETKYESEKKDKELLKKESEIISRQADADRKSTQRNFFIAGFGLMILMTVLVFRSYNQKKKANAEISLQKNIIEEKQKEIVDSITYAKRLQEAILPPDILWNKYLPESFVLYVPKDIVAGDFYWMHVSSEMGVRGSETESSRLGVWSSAIENSKRKGSESRVASSETGIEGFEKVINATEATSSEIRNLKIISSAGSILIAAADCTGHGVPGAIMSMLGAEKLNEAAIHSGDVSEILSMVNVGVKKALRQSDNENSTRDGMDLALCSFSASMTQLDYAGANRPLWIIRNGSRNIEEIKPTKNAIGGLTEDEKEFSKHSVSLQKGDTVYLFSDGYADQFNSKGKKLMTKAFKETLVQIQNLSMPEQKNHLLSHVKKWKGNAEQTDDILVIGVRV